ncbi:DegT/DnrJ/EryC1/StrS family aminotransferase [Lishizhenia sp.]|uniref:DegT/DnrJ/EryC1/StrS family aminotransferase n=1 Tax=Lishizhenia sp. TaxID=2497594 RepID=UPI00299F2394|nr:DegT/DnrJ/EryC1/StrS family aminotransferase [Lishizhenia sp.]MDX1446045.1 DegT/DnrJ/EryC1/StrS family aminotransferase [Lishizhenia sp.]
MKINVTQTYLPPQEEYQAYLKKAWENNWLTNRGELVEELEEKLRAYLGVQHMTLTTNGTLPLQIALKTLEIKGEVITTPFSYVASVSSIVWEGCTPVFVDIDPEYWTLDESKIEEAITEKTTAILATHVFGNACHVEAIQSIADKHNLKVIYDGAHCFGVQYKGQSIFNYGDVSTCSFHATKIFHTGEGGAWFTKDQELQDKLFYHHNFGHKGQEAFHGLGINAKMSELQAAMGLAVFDHIIEISEGRKKAVAIYDELLEGRDLQKIKLRAGTSPNYHYYPVVFKSEEELLKVQKALNTENIYPRRYFYPCLEELDYVVANNCSVAQEISKRVMCLPLWESISPIDQQQISKIIEACL